MIQLNVSLRVNLSTCAESVRVGSTTELFKWKRDGDALKWLIRRRKKKRADPSCLRLNIDRSINQAIRACLLFDLNSDSSCNSKSFSRWDSRMNRYPPHLSVYFSRDPVIVTGNKHEYRQTSNDNWFSLLFLFHSLINPLPLLLLLIRRPVWNQPKGRESSHAYLSIC